MAIEEKNRAGPVTDDDADEDLIDTLIAISVVAKRLAMKLINEKGGQRNEQNERTVSGA